MPNPVSYFDYINPTKRTRKSRRPTPVPQLPTPPPTPTPKPTPIPFVPLPQVRHTPTPAPGPTPPAFPQIQGFFSTPPTPTPTPPTPTPTPKPTPKPAVGPGTTPMPDWQNLKDTWKIFDHMGLVPQLDVLTGLPDPTRYIAKYEKDPRFWFPGQKYTPELEQEYQRVKDLRQEAYNIYLDKSGLKERGMPQKQYREMGKLFGIHPGMDRDFGLWDERSAQVKNLRIGIGNRTTIQQVGDAYKDIENSIMALKKGRVREAFEGEVGELERLKGELRNIRPSGDEGVGMSLEGALKHSRMSHREGSNREWIQSSKEHLERFVETRSNSLTLNEIDVAKSEINRLNMLLGKSPATTSSFPPMPTNPIGTTGEILPPPGITEPPPGFDYISPPGPSPDVPSYGPNIYSRGTLYPQDSLGRVSPILATRHPYDPFTERAHVPRMIMPGVSPGKIPDLPHMSRTEPITRAGVEDPYPIFAPGLGRTTIDYPSLQKLGIKDIERTPEEKEMFERLKKEYSPEGIETQYKQMWEQYKPELREMHKEEQDKLKQYLAQIGGLEGTGIESMRKLLIDQGRRTSQIKSQLLTAAREQGLKGMEGLISRLEKEREVKQQTEIQRMTMQQQTEIQRFDTYAQLSTRVMEVNNQRELAKFEADFKGVLTEAEYTKQMNELKSQLTQRTREFNAEMSMQRENAIRQYEQNKALTTAQLQQQVNLQWFDTYKDIKLREAEMIYNEQQSAIQRNYELTKDYNAYINQKSFIDQELVNKTQQINQMYAFEKEKMIILFDQEAKIKEAIMGFQANLANAIKSNEQLSLMQHVLTIPRTY